MIERKLIGNSMAKGDEQFRILFEQANEGIFIADKLGHYLDVNPAGCRMLGYSHEEITQLTISDIITDNEVERINPEVEKVLSDGRIKNHWKFKRKDQSVFVGEVTVNKLSDERLQAMVRNVTEQMQEKEVLGRNEERSRITLDHMLEGCQIIGFDWRYLYINRAAEKHNRRANEELMGNRYMDMWPGIEETEVFALIRQTLDQRVSHHMENKFFFPDGAMGWYDLSIQPVPEGAFILSVDITERKIAEEEMFTSKAQLETALNSMTDAVIITDANGNFLEFNEAFASFHRFKSKADCAKTLVEYPAFFDVFKTDGQPAPLEQWPIPRALRGESAKNAEFILRRKDTGETWIGSYSFAPILDSNGIIVGSVVAGRDVTESKQADAALKLSEERYRNIFESAVIGLYRTTPEGKILMANSTLVKMLGFDSFEELSQRNLEMEGFEDNEQRKKFRQLIEQDGRIIGLEAIWKTKAGKSVFVNENARAFYDDEGQIIYYEGTIEDITERKQAEEALRYNEALLREMERIGQIGGWEFYPQTGLVNWTEEVSRIHDLDPTSKVQVQTGINYYYGDSIPIIQEAVRESLELAKPYDLELEILSAKGIHKWVRAIGHPVVEKGEVVKVKGSVQDITQRKEAEMALKKSEDLFSKAFHGSPSPMTIATKKDGLYIAANDSFLRLIELSHDEVIGQDGYRLNLIDLDDRMKLRQELVEKGAVHNAEVRARSSKGKALQLLISIENTELAGEPCTIATMLDITERKKAEEEIKKLNETLEQRVEERTIQLQAANKELSDSRAELSNLFESLPGLYLVITPDYEIVSASDAYLKATLTTREGILGHDFFEVFPDNPDDPETKAVSQMRASIESVKTNAKTDNMAIARHDIRRADGSFEVRYWSPINSPMFGGDGQVKYIIHRVEEVTEFVQQKENFKEFSKNLNARELQMEAEIFKSSQQLKASNEQLEAANKELEAFSYSVSHDLRAPLRHINGFVDLLGEKYENLLPDKGKHYLEVIVNSSRQMGTLIDDLLQFSRTGRQEMQQANLDMNLVLQDVINLISPDIQERKIVWKVAELPVITGDHALLRMVWYNLLSNAIKFTKTKDPAIITIGFQHEIHEYVFFIKDNGAGFDMRYSNKLFGVFQRLHSKEEFEGTGIGLANVRRIVLKHGGRTWAESAPGQGATFYFTIPLKQEKEK